MTYPPGPANPGTPQQPGFYLNQLAPPRPPKPPWPAWKILGLAVVLFLPVVAVFWIGSVLTDTEPSKPAAQSTGIGTPAPYDDRPEQRITPTGAAADSAGNSACDQVKASLATGRIDPAALAGAGVTGYWSKEMSIRIASGLVEDAAKLAVAARGAPDEQRMLDSLAKSARSMEQTCTTWGYYA